MDSALEFWVFLPQMRMTMDQLVDRAQAAEAAGFAGVASMDHLAPPGAEGSPMFEAMITNAWLAGRTEHLHVGSLVLCDSFRHLRCWRGKRSHSTMPPEGASSSASAGARSPTNCGRSASDPPNRRSV